MFYAFISLCVTACWCRKCKA